MNNIKHTDIPEGEEGDKALKNEIDEIKLKIAETTDTKICSDCGSLIDKDATFCKKCGNKVE